MNDKKRQILVTSALPYANGAIHLGHMLEYIQTDIWARFQRSRGHECYFAWADDAHGTPVMLWARSEGKPPEELIDRMNEEHKGDFRDFGISFDNYTSTHSEFNRQIVEKIYANLDAAGHIARRDIEQLYDEQEGMFLPDRFIRGTCPKCKTPDQYGDSCEACGSTYSPTELIDARSAVSGSAPVLRKSEHFFFRLSAFEEALKEWMAAGSLQPEIVNKLQEWFTDGLRDWDISRDAPYFGFRIPGTENKYFYVWVDAPVGYAASFRELCERTGMDFDAWWGPDSTTELHHFIGKDIVYFHTLFWPAVLRATGVTPGQLSLLTLLQTGLMGLYAGVLSLPLGWLMSRVLIEVINRRSFGWSIETHLPAAALPEAVLLALSAALLAGLYPAWRMRRVQPAQALREE